MEGEFDSVVVSDGIYIFTSESFDGFFVHELCSRVVDFFNNRESGFSVDDGHEIALPILTDDEITLEVACIFAAVDMQRSILSSESFD